MKKIHQYLAQKQVKFSHHPFFHQMAHDSNLDQLRCCATRLSFWIMSFQDLLRLNQMRVKDVKLCQVIQQHLVEDADHEQWFLKDLKQINIAEPSLKLLYSNSHTPTRDATYVLMSEVFQARNDYERIVLLLTLESAGHIFFEHIANFVERINYSDHLQYFSKFHLKVEKNHELFEQRIEAYLESIQLTHDEEKRMFEMIDRIYEAFMAMFNGLAMALTSRMKVLELLN